MHLAELAHASTPNVPARSWGRETGIPAINYSTAPLNNTVAEVNKKVQEGTLQLAFEGRSGFLRSALEALQIPVDSQLLVFSRASLQGGRINEQNPRALFFNDRVAIGWVRGGEYDRSGGSRPVRRRRVLHARTACRCNGRPAAVQAGVPVPGVPHGRRHARRARPVDVQHDPPGRTAQEFDLPRSIDHSDALSRRFGGWFVTVPGSEPHLGNDVPALDECQPRARVGGGIVRRGRLPRSLERHRCPPRVHPPDANDEPPDARQLGATRSQSVAAPAVHARRRRRRALP